MFEGKRKGTKSVRRSSNMMGKEQDGEAGIYEERGLPLMRLERMWINGRKRKHLEVEIRKHERIFGR